MKTNVYTAVLALSTLLIPYPVCAAPAPGSIASTITLVNPLVTKIVDLPILQKLGNITLGTLVPPLRDARSPLISGVANIPLVGAVVKALPQEVLLLGSSLVPLQKPLPGLGALDAVLAPVVIKVAAAVP